MAEFQEVMRQFDRMCKAHAGCVDCPLSIKGTVETKCSIGSFIDESEYVEQEIMRWAAEHPEPVYPTWGEWFVEHGDLVDGWQNATNAAWMANTALSIFMKPIPADIAGKLGIDPKEGV